MPSMLAMIGRRSERQWVAGRGSAERRTIRLSSLNKRPSQSLGDRPGRGYAGRHQHAASRRHARDAGRGHAPASGRNSVAASRVQISQVLAGG
jgi:hypothetical protein